jgi:galactokinase
MQNKIYSTPGRICLFGEHQDYLGLPVIAAAISRRINVSGSQRADKEVVVNKPNINSQEIFNLDNLTYSSERDYFKSSIKVLKEIGFEFEQGFDVEIDGNIPINSGTSSSSALIVSWINFLSQNAKNPQKLEPKYIAELANKAEVLEFGEPGGMMDHYSTAMGNLIYLESQPKIYVETLKPKLGTFVLGDSLEPKDTIGILSFVKNGMLKILAEIKEFNPNFDLKSITLSEVEVYRNAFNAAEFNLLKANVSDKEILKTALEELRKPIIDELKFGKLLTQHQENLREHKKISTPKINKMLDAALNAGALGGKINGSGGGGCMFAYAPQNADNVVQAIENVGGKAYLVEVCEGTE